MNNPAPLPVNIDADTLPVMLIESVTVTKPSTSTLPTNVEPLSLEVTTNPSSGVTVAETAPLIISVITISVNSAPLPLNVDADTNVTACIDVSTLTEPVNCEPTV